MTEQPYKLILFVSGMSVRSSLAIENLKEICDTHVKDNFSLDIIDVSKEKSKAQEYGIFALPTLVKLNPPPKRFIIGDMSDTQRVLKSLDIVL